MADIMITCPATGKTVPTGMSMEPEEFENADLGLNTFQCPACDEPHTWNKKDAFLGQAEE